MTRRPTKALIEELGRGLRPVRPIPRLRFVLAIAALLASVAAIWRFSHVDPRPDLAALLSGTPAFAAVAAGLALFAAGAALWVAGASVPGRERVAAAGRTVSAAGAGLALLLAPVCVVLAADDPARWLAQADLGCAIGSVVVGVVPALWLVVFTRWAAPPRLARAGALGTAAGVGAGALAIHATCPAPDSWHWIFGHSAAPLAAGLLVLVLLALARRLRS